MSITAQGQRNERMLNVATTVARHYDLSARELFGPSRHQPVAWARQVAMVLCVEELGESHSSVGFMFGGRHRSAVNYARRIIRDQIEVEPATQKEIDQIREALCQTVT